jgi:HEAT repeat protein
MEKTREHLILSLNDSDENERLYAIEDIFDAKLNDLSIELINRLKIEKSNAVKNSIVSVLQQLEHSDIYKELFEFFSSESAFLRNSAVSIFSSYGEEAVVFLSSYIDHGNREVRKLILDALVEIASKNHETISSIVDIFRACLHDPQINVVITVVEYLGRLNDHSSAQDMIELFLRNEEPMLRSSILDTLQKIGKKDSISNVITSLKNQEVISNSLYTPQILRLFALSGKKEEFLELLREIPDINNYSSEIISSFDYLVKNEGLDIDSIIDTIVELNKNNQIKEELKSTSVNILISSSNPKAREIIKSWAVNGTEEFRNYCNELLNGN